MVILDTDWLPPMTKAQFYCEFAVQFVLGCCFVYALAVLAARDARHGWEPSRFGAWLQDRLGIGMLIMAGLASYFVLPDVYYAFIDDATEVISDGATAIAGAVVDGDDLAEELGLNIGGNDTTAGVIWGRPSESQHEAFMLMAGFFLSLGLCAYIFTFKASPAGIVKKALKVVAYSLLGVVILFQPENLHRFTWPEVSAEATCLLTALVLIYLTHSRHQTPPPLPPPVPPTA